MHTWPRRTKLTKVQERKVIKLALKLSGWLHPVLCNNSIEAQPSPHNLTDARQDQGCFSGAHPQKTFATWVNVAKLELSGLNEAKLPLYASVSSLDLWIHYIGPVIVHIRVERHSGKESSRLLLALVTNGGVILRAPGSFFFFFFFHFCNVF